LVYAEAMQAGLPVVACASGGIADLVIDGSTGLLVNESAPAEIADTWSKSLIAFAWETLVTVATQLAAGVGRDSAKRPLIPATIAADRSVLLIGAMARHALGTLGAP